MSSQPLQPQPQQQYEMKGGEYPPGYGYQPPPQQGYQPPPPQYGQPPPGQTTVLVPQPVTMVRDPAAHVPDNMVISIISMFFCCIIGVIAVFKANSSKEKLRAGDIQSAEADAASAKKLAIAAIVTGVIIIALTIFITVILPLILAVAVVADTHSEIDSMGDY